MNEQKLSRHVMLAILIIITAGCGSSDKEAVIESEPIIETIHKRGEALMKGFGEILTEAGIPHYLPGVPPMFGIVLGNDQEPHDFRDYFKGDGDLYENLALELIRRGVQPDSDAREPWFLCYALSEADVDETLNIFNDSVKAVKG